MRCNNCNTEVPNDSVFCPKCGSQLIRRIKKNWDIILLAIAIGVWILVLQNLGIIPVSKNVKVTNVVETERTR